MVPNQYWVPGMGSPMPIMGKYYVFYGGGYTTPNELGRKNVERMVYELINDNCGVCRFHRQWSEPLLEIMINDRFGLNLDFKAHHYKMAQEINEHERGKSIPWETERMAELFFNYLEYCGDSGSEDPAMFRWQNHEDNLMTAQAFWQAILDGQEIAFRAGAEFIPDSLTPAQYKNKLKMSG
jgi:glyceraldehyde-3-phosphate dehydrogenase (ferredoxin)